MSDAQPTVEVLLRLLAERDALIAAQAQTIAQLQATVARLEGRVAELEARLGMNSTNSHLPPSSDGPGKPVKPAPRSLRGNSGRSPAGSRVIPVPRCVWWMIRTRSCGMRPSGASAVAQVCVGVR